MNLYLISQNQNTGYDTYDAAVVRASNEDRARKIAPTGELWDEITQGWKYCSGWIGNLELIKVELLGTCDDEHSGLVLASFNAG